MVEPGGTRNDVYPSEIIGFIRHVEWFSEPKFTTLFPGRFGLLPRAGPMRRRPQRRAVAPSVRFHGARVC